MNCLWIIILLFCFCNQGSCSSERECGCEKECAREERQNWECRNEPRRRSAFDDREETECPCRREFDYFQAEVKEAEEKNMNL